MKDALNQQIKQLRNRINDPFTINLHILGQTMNLTIERSEEALYASLYADVRDKNRFAAMTLLDLALMLQRGNEEKSQVVSKLTEITQHITNQLNESLPNE